MSITDRKKLILSTIIREYYKTAQPVSSGGLVEKYGLGISPATVRNEMMELEDDGYIFQPHTSAGRQPTEKAYEIYVNEFLAGDKKKLSLGEKRQLDGIFKNNELAFRGMAKAMAELSGNAIFWAFHKNDLYHTGLSNLFSQVEFKQADLVCNTSAVIDRLEEIIDGIYNDVKLGSQILIGSGNPFGDFLSVAILKYKRDNKTGMVGILGPLRMDYEKNLALLKYLEEKL
jgi:heat-inducible transcriptional repressor